MCKDFYEEKSYGSVGTCDAAAVAITQLNWPERSKPWIYCSNG